jgi:hypothetical protein
MLSGLKECGECGGGFRALDRAGVFGCGPSRDRGPTFCSSRLRAPYAELEQRVLGAIEENLLTPQRVQHVAERPLEIVRAQLDDNALARDDARIAELDVQIGRAVELGVRTGGMDAVMRKLEDLREERTTLAAKVGAAPKPLTQVELRHRAEALARDLRAVFALAGDDARVAIRALLGEQRIRVRAEAGGRFALTGTFQVHLKSGPGTEIPGPQGLVAGARFGTLRVAIPWAA